MAHSSRCSQPYAHELYLASQSAAAIKEKRIVILTIKHIDVDVFVAAGRHKCTRILMPPPTSSALGWKILLMFLPKICACQALHMKLDCQVEDWWGAASSEQKAWACLAEIQNAFEGRASSS